ncbi:MAG: GAF domain-containing sensor histidine kinase [Deltaproteobacteria bacterium]|nr:GAF domain-containing sensor histidine kinase [Deltaproteobacteria bacterium]
MGERDNQSDQLSARWRAREEARLRVLRLRVSDAASLDAGLTKALSIGAAALKVERVGVWLFDEPLEHLECVLLLDGKSVVRERPSLRIVDLGVYSALLRDRRALAASDVRAEPLTRDLVESYFAPHGIEATLDVPLYRGGQVVGVLCHEHRGGVRKWTAGEADFAISLADMVSLMYATHELHDAEERLQESEEELAETHAVEAVTRLSRGVAHDINNVLGVIMLAVGAMNRRINDPEAVKAAAASVSQAADSAARLARQLLDLGRFPDPPAQELAAVVVDALVLAQEPTLRGLAGEERTLTITPGAQGATAQIHPTRLERVLHNLVVNAREATGAGGHIRVSTRVQAARKGQREAVVLEVQDDGVGMSDGTRVRIFDPFFSTKSASGNKGLGLATSLGIVRDAGGHIEVESEPEKGAMFRVLLPKA